MLTTSYDPRTGAMQDAGYRLSRTLRTRTSSTELLLIGFLRISTQRTLLRAAVLFPVTLALLFVLLAVGHGGSFERPGL